MGVRGAFSALLIRRWYGNSVIFLEVFAEKESLPKLKTRKLLKVNKMEKPSGMASTPLESIRGTH